MHRPWTLWGVMLLILTLAALAGAAERSYARPVETVWNEAVKSARDANLVVVDSDRDSHLLVLRSKAWYSSKKGLKIRVTLSGSDGAVTVRAEAVDPETAERLAKTIAKYLDALDARLD